MRLHIAALPLVLVLGTTTTALAQPARGGESAESEVTAFNALNLELLGPAGIYALNYERRFSDVAMRLGFSYFSVSASSGEETAKASLLTIPITASYIGVGGRAAKFEVGGGGVLAYASAEASSGYGETANGSGMGAWGTVLVGFRLHPDNGGFQFRVGASPLIGPGGFFPWGYISFGAAF